MSLAEKINSIDPVWNEEIFDRAVSKDTDQLYEPGEYTHVADFRSLDDDGCGSIPFLTEFSKYIQNWGDKSVCCFGS